MDLLHIQPTHTSPEVTLNSGNKILSLKGRSSPENSLMFYQRIYDTIDQYFINEQTINVHLLFEYFNTSSSKCIFVLFRQLKKYVDDGYDVNINWFYEEDDDDMLETGEDYADIINVDINMIEVPDINDLED